jgi:hypothetical protein
MLRSLRSQTAATARWLAVRVSGASTDARIHLIGRRFAEGESPLRKAVYDQVGWYTVGPVLVRFAVVGQSPEVP